MRVLLLLLFVSAPSLVSISEKGARFKSYHDCSIKSLTPERSIEIQRQLGADLVVVLGERRGDGQAVDLALLPIMLASAIRPNDFPVLHSTH